MVDLDPIPLADGDDDGAVRRCAVGDRRRERAVPERVSPGRPPWPLLARCVAFALAILHGLAIWWGLGGREGLTNGWPLWRDDHPLYYHSALVTRAFLGQSGTTAGYDPSFMAGYPKSVVFPASSTLPELVVWAFGGDNPALAYKVYVLVSAAAIPWLVILAAAVLGVRPFGQAAGVFLYLLYVWTDFPINYAAFGMLPYLLAIPLGLLATAVFARYLNQGGLTWWLVSAGLMSLCVLVHLTTAMVVVPAAALGYAAACLGRAPDRSRPVEGWSTAPGWRTRPSAAAVRSLDTWGSGSSRSSSWPRTHSGGCRESGWRRPRARATSPSATRGRASWHDWSRSSPPERPFKA